MINTDSALIARAGLLVELQRRTHPPGGEVRRGQAAADLERVLVIRAERALPVREDLLVLGDGVLGLAARQVGGGQPEAG